MHHSIKYGIAAAGAVLAVEYMFTTSWYQGTSFSQSGNAGGMAFDAGVGAGIGVLLGMLLG